MGRLDGKVALITGGARGQGAQEAELFAGRGSVGRDHRRARRRWQATAVAIGDRATYHHHDVTREADWTSVVDAVLAEHGQLDVLVNNAGIVAIAPLVMTTEEDYRRVIDVEPDRRVPRDEGRRAAHGRASDRLDHQHLVGRRPDGLARDDRVRREQVGRAGHDESRSRSKWRRSVCGSTRSIRASSTHRCSRSSSGGGSCPRSCNVCPSGRKADAIEVAQLALYLASDESAYSTGSEFVVDGGMTAS